MKNYDTVAAPEDIPTKVYVDDRIAVQGTQPAGAEIWIDTAAPDPGLTMEEQLAALTARVEALEGRSG